jgi:hypothetical protein
MISASELDKLIKDMATLSARFAAEESRKSYMRGKKDGYTFALKDVIVFVRELSDATMNFRNQSIFVLLANKIERLLLENT